MQHRLSATLFILFLRRSPLHNSVPPFKHPETAEGMDGEMGQRKGGAGHPGTRERHAFAHQLFFLLSEPEGRERAPLSLWDPSLFSPPPTPATPALPPLCRQCEWRATFTSDEWDGMGMGRGSFWPPQPSNATATCAAYYHMNPFTAEGCFTLPSWTDSQTHFGSLGQLWWCFIGDWNHWVLMCTRGNCG